MIRHWRLRKKAARCMAFMLALSLIFPGTVYAASAMDIAPNEEVYGEYQDPSAGIPDENEAMEAAAAGQGDDFSLPEEEWAAADAVSAEEGAEGNEIFQEPGNTLAGDESFFPEAGTGETADGSALTEDETDGSQWNDGQAAEEDEAAEDYEDPTGAETDGTDADEELSEPDPASTEEDASLSGDGNTIMDGSQDMAGEETDPEAGEAVDEDSTMDDGEEISAETIDGIDEEAGEETDEETIDGIDEEAGEETDAEIGGGIEEEAGEGAGEEPQEELDAEESQEDVENPDETAGSAEAGSTEKQEAGKEAAPDSPAKGTEEAAKAAEDEKSAQAVTAEEQAAVPASDAGVEEVNKITSISFKDSSASPVLGVQGINKFQLELNVEYDTATSYEADEPYYFRSSNESVLKVDEKGLLTAVASGGAYIYVYTKTSDGQTDWLSKYIYVYEKAFQVKFNLNGGTLKSTDSMYKEGKILTNGNSIYIYASDSVAERAGYRFDGWTETKNGADVISGSYTPTANVTLYAKWTRVFTVKFSPHGAAWKEDYYKERYGGGITDEKGKSIYLPSGYTMVRDGYEFLGWTVEKNGTPVLTGKYTITKDITLYAKWAKLYTVKFNLNGGKWKDSDYYANGIQKKKNEKAYLPSDYYVARSGYKFLGWTFAKDGKTMAESPYTVTKDITLYAKWKQTFKVTFNAGKGWFGADNTQHKQVVEVPTGECIGSYLSDLHGNPQNGTYAFLGWYKDSKLTSPVKKSDTITKNITYYAKWQAKTYKITVTNLKGASYSNRATGDYVYSSNSTANSYAFYLAQGESIGSIFAYKDGEDARFFFDKACKTMPYYYNYIPTGNTTVFAKWDTDVTITWNANGGKDYDGDTSGKVTCRKGLMCENLPDDEEMIRDGYYFVGWYDTANTSKILAPSHVFTKNTTVKAKWAKGIKITFRPNGGKFSKGDRSVIYIKAKTKIGSRRPWSVTREGYVLKGWKNSVTGKIVQSLYDEKPAKDTMYTAAWTKATEAGATVTVTLQAGAGSIYDWNNRKYVTKFAVKVPKNATLAQTEIYEHRPDHDEAYKHLQLSGWSTSKNGSAIKASYKFTKNVTLYPVWKKHTGLYVALVTNGGTIDRYPDNDPEILDVAKKGDTVALPAASRMEREGYTFAGWYSDAALKTKMANPNKVKVNKCRYIYAKWKKK